MVLSSSLSKIEYLQLQELPGFYQVRYCGKFDDAEKLFLLKLLNIFSIKDIEHFTIEDIEHFEDIEPSFNGEKIPRILQNVN